MVAKLSKDIKKAVTALKKGRVIAIPTETVYGLAADATNTKAINQIFKIKGRPTHHPLIVHVYSANNLKNWAVNIPESAYKLAKTFWPGPLTLVLKKAPDVSKKITGGQNTIALRAPKHPLTREILKQLKGAFVAPSANRFGHVSPTTPAHVKADLGNKLSLIMDGGACQIGIESTILDLTHKKPVILRPGMISQKAIEKVLKTKVAIPTSHQQKQLPRVPGSLLKHYAPRTKAILVPAAELNKIISKLSYKQTLAVLSQTKINKTNNVFPIPLSKKPENYAKKLYHALRAADRLNVDMIVIEQPKNTPTWHAILDRLLRATKN